MHLENNASAKDSALNQAMQDEQKFVNEAYSALDTQLSYYHQQLERVRRQGGTGTPSTRTERDSFATHYENSLTQLRNVENRLVLGRIDTNDKKVIHIGRTTLRNKEQNIILTDWRAPQSEPFYQATAAHPQNIARRRHIQTRFRKVTNIEDEFLAGNNDKNNEITLTGEGALFAAMNRARDGKMSDILATIQGEQDRIIRADAQGILVVQGGPGTGKTAVALHRAAYLLYTHRKHFSRSGILIVGPSKNFLNYIDQVLPALGESDTVSLTIAELLPNVTVTATESADIAEIKGRTIWAEITTKAISSILQKPATNTAFIDIDGKTITLTPEEIKQAQINARNTHKPHNEAREIYAKQLVKLLAKKLASEKGTDIEHDTWIMADVAGDPDVRRIVNRHWLPADEKWLLRHLFKWPEVLKTVAPQLNASERAKLKRDPKNGFTEADIAILDEMAAKLGTIKNDAKTNALIRENNELFYTASGHALADRAVADRNWTYGHVIVDEAQELSPLQWRMIARRNPAHSMTLVGDLDQLPNGKPGQTWQEILGKLGTKHRVEKLTISYRTPKEILEYATKLMDALQHPVRKVQAVREISNSCIVKKTTPTTLLTDLKETLTQEIANMDIEYGKNQGTLAIIAPVQLHPYLQSLLSTLDFCTNSTQLTGRKISLHTPRETKGLEYDITVLLEPQNIFMQAPGDLYVSLTRATKKMIILSTTDFPSPNQIRT